MTDFDNYALDLILNRSVYALGASIHIPSPTPLCSVYRTAQSKFFMAERPLWK